MVVSASPSLYLSLVVFYDLYCTEVYLVNLLVNILEYVSFESMKVYL